MCSRKWFLKCMRSRYPYLFWISGYVNREWVAQIGLQLNQGDGTVWLSAVFLIVPSGCGCREGLGRPGLNRANGERAISAKAEYINLQPNRSQSHLLYYLRLLRPTTRVPSSLDVVIFGLRSINTGWDVPCAIMRRHHSWVYLCGLSGFQPRTFLGFERPLRRRGQLRMDPFQSQSGILPCNSPTVGHTYMERMFSWTV